MNLSKIYSVLGHERRRKIVEIVGLRKKVRASELRKTMRVSPGTLYYDLDVLKKLGILRQCSDGALELTEEGQIAYRFILKEKEILETLMTSTIRLPEKLIKLGTKLSRALIPINLFSFLANHVAVFLPLTALTYIASLVLAVYNNLYLKLFNHYVGSYSVGYTVLTYIVTLGVIASIITITSRLVDVKLRTGKNLAAILTVTLATLLPISLQPIVYTAVKLATSQPLATIVLAMLQPITQILTLLFLTAAIYVITNIKLDRCFIIAALLYIVNTLINAPTIPLPTS
ncbi:MAG: hypothetical protein DRJ40_08720 [Thermoprotei archaeon]|nr:MAG: hypothetical protein DRJ40_08720 [Thermoprotei archaeon]